MTDFPYKQKDLLNNSIEATTTVRIVDGMQVSQTVFTTAAGDLGSVTLSPQNTTAGPIHLAQSTQELTIASIHFQAAFGLVQGSVSCKGWSTDQDGSGHDPFDKHIAEWGAPSS